MSNTPRTDAVADYWLEPGMSAEHEIVPAQIARELERELAALNERFEQLANAATRVEWKFGRNDDGSPKDWTEWNDLRESLGERVRRPQELASNEAEH